MGLFIGNRLVSPAEIVNIGGEAGKYSLLERISDDNGNEIGTVSGFFTDGNNVEYAVVCLDSTYRLESAKWENPSSGTAITGLPQYSNWTLWEAKETATFNTQKILDWEATHTSYTHPAVSHCRSKSFVINGVTYYGQLPNIIELVDIAKNRTAINNADTSGGSLANDNYCWSSSQTDSTRVWCMNNNATIGWSTKVSAHPVCPVLEIPNVVA